MSAERSRLIYVDDTSPLISYKEPGHWAGGDKYYSATGNTINGGPFNKTLRALSGSGSFNFNFTGPSVSVIASFVGSGLPSWTCFIDGNALISNVVPQVTASSVEICSLQNIVIKATPSNLTVNASGSDDRPFLFDRIQYALDPSVIMDNATVVVDAFDNQIHYDSGWSKLGSIGMETSVRGSSMSFDFVGIQLTWVTTIDVNANTTTNSSAKYSIDNGTLFPFQVNAQNSTVQMYNLISFQTPILPPGPHRLFVQYGNDSSGTAPLILDHLVIQNFTRPPSTSPSHARLPKGAIAGIVIGTLIGFAIIVVGLIRVIRSRKVTAASSQRYTAPNYGDGSR
ncbi:hypothetical protein M413DRAFT_27552 [Hebeloma cylindrosporum]|uniref:Transmembrane protein n=1 Tax=Hebeloma cylindrosporum TaxID=76867 RepID=A0A0C3CCQ3_HEBCY|nr:hypothetical protein M413DRAFT_27552 [Hebeloma cylindrosporum h7]